MGLWVADRGKDAACQQAPIRSTTLGLLCAPNAPSTHTHTAHTHDTHIRKKPTRPTHQYKQTHPPHCAYTQPQTHNAVCPIPHPTPQARSNSPARMREITTDSVAATAMALYTTPAVCSPLTTVPSHTQDALPWSQGPLTILTQCRVPGRSTQSAASPVLAVLTVRTLYAQHMHPHLHVTLHTPTHTPRPLVMGTPIPGGLIRDAAFDTNTS